MPIREIPKAKRQRDAAIIAAVAAVPIAAFVVVGWHWGAAGFAVLAVLAIVLTLRVATESAPDPAVLAEQKAREEAQQRQEARNRLAGYAADDALYRVGFLITWVVAFLGCWIYCIASYGFLIGVGIGWLPSAIAATVVAFLWPLLVLAALVLALVVAFNV
jgi:MFS family permease